MFEVQSATKGPNHHFFGFHDLVQWNQAGNLMLGLQVDNISHPPLPGEMAKAGIIDSDSKEFAPIHDTCAFNYPQGARQQWYGESNLFFTNDRVNGRCVARLSNAESLKVQETFDFPVHILNHATNEAFYINYDRLHRVGGYGYVGGRDDWAEEDIPTKCGIFKGCLKSGKHELMVSVAQVAACSEKNVVKTGYPHYLTHLCLNPSKTRIAFLHRYRVVDGGEITRLMTVGCDGSDLRCLAKGFLSHFDWLDDKHVLIWGRDERSMSRMREAAWLRIPGVLHGALLAKQGVRLLRRLRYGMGTSVGSAGSQHKAFLKIYDKEGGEAVPIGVGVLVEDGHPMRNPAINDVIVNDTYPDEVGERELMLYSFSQGKRIELGRYKMLSDVPDANTFDAALAMQGVDKRVRHKFKRDLYLFTRSGLHCDLHPRWNAQGTKAAFDSIHEGSRQIYTIDCKEIMDSNGW